MTDNPPARPPLRRTRRSRITIESLRTLVLIGGGVLVLAIAGFLAIGHWKRHFLTKDLPHRLGIDIQQQANGVDYTQSRKGKTLFRIHAARAVQMKQNGQTQLHDVRIDLYDEDGRQADTITGSEFEYDPELGQATAAGLVEITLMRPSEKPAVADIKPGANKTSATQPSPTQNNSASKQTSLQPGSHNSIDDDQIHVKTSGLTFDQKTGSATTTQRVDFALRQGTGTSIGATYESTGGRLILDNQVELHVQSGATPLKGGSMTIHAQHAEFGRTQQLCTMVAAQADYSGDTARSGNAVIHLRGDGTVAQLDGSDNVDLQTQTGGHVTAPRGSLYFDNQNHPSHGLLEGGTQFELRQPDRHVQGSASTAHLVFDSQGQLHLVHLERGVVFHSEQQGTNAKGIAEKLFRSWTSQIADVTFAPASPAAIAHATNLHPSSGSESRPPAGQVEARTIRGTGGVVVTSVSNAPDAPGPSKLSANTVVAELAPGEVLSSLSGTGNAMFEEQAGVQAIGSLAHTNWSRRTSRSDQLDVKFAPSNSLPAAPSSSRSDQPVTKSASEGIDNAGISSVLQVGHVILVQEPAPQPASAAKPGSQQPAQTASVEIRATGDRADFDGQTQMMHLSGNPRIHDGALDLTAKFVDFSRTSGDAFARVDVRATWATAAGQGNAPAGLSLLAPASLALTPGSGNPSGPVHAIAGEAELDQTTQQVILRNAPAEVPSASNQPRLWQGGNSVAAPVITLNHQTQTLTATGNLPANPVHTVLIDSSGAPRPSNSKSSNSSPASAPSASSAHPSQKSSGNSAATPAIIRVRSASLRYSDAERIAHFESGSPSGPPSANTPGAAIQAETSGPSGTAIIHAQQAEVTLKPATNNPLTAKPPVNTTKTTAGASSGSNSQPNSAIDRMVAQGHVTIDSPGRTGSGEKLVYLSDDGTFTLTGTAAAPPRMQDEVRGTVTGSALIFHTGDDSVTVEGGGARTVTETHSGK